MRRLVLLAGSLAASMVLAHAQTGTLTGRVVAEPSGQPVANARVAVLSPELGAPVVLTDASGRFSLPAPAGTFSLTASKTGFAPRTLQVRDAAAAIAIPLVRAAALAGRVVNDLGEPASGVRITVERAAGPAPRGSAPVASTRTDDRGEFRLGGLAPGRYVVAAATIGPTITQVTSANRVMRMSPRSVTMYYPAAASRDGAEVFDLEPGSEVNTISFLVAAEAAAGNDPFSALRVAAVGAGAAPMPRGTGNVEGRVVDSSGRGLAGADVVLVRAANMLETSRLRTGPDGSFQFNDLPGGAFRLAASKSGYAAASGGGIALRSFELTTANPRARIDLDMAAWSAIGGRVLDEYGDPIQGASVQVLQIRYENGRRRLVPTGMSAGPTDDRGAYRVFRLMPGAYVVSASIGEVSTTDVPGYARTYFPGTPDTSQAQFVAVRQREAPGIDFALTRARTARISGRLRDPAGAPTMGGTVQLKASDRSASVTSAPVGARIERDGSFEFPNVPDGQYVIQAYRGQMNAWTEGEFGAVPVVVNGTDVANVVVAMTRGSTVYGLVVYEGQNGDAPDGAAVAISVIPVDYDASPPTGLAAATAGPSGRFQLAGLHGPRRLHVQGIPDGWALREILVNGADATDRPVPFGTTEQSVDGVEVILTDLVTSLRATAVDRDGRSMPGLPLVVFPTDRNYWYDRSRYLTRTTTDAQGAMAIDGLPFGTYYVAPAGRVPDEGPDAWQDPGFLESLTPAATSVTLTEGRPQSVTLTIR